MASSVLSKFLCKIGCYWLLKQVTLFCVKIVQNQVIFVSLSPGWLTHRVITDKVHRQFVTLSYFRPDRFVQLLSLIPILFLLLYLLVSIDLVYTDICELDIRNYLEGEQLSSILKENN